MAVGVIAELLEKYGQGGSCMEDECSFTYHNSFLVSDRKEAWLLETSGKMWAAERVKGKDEKSYKGSVRNQSVSEGSMFLQTDIETSPTNME